jgi:hypothetical protein
MAHDHDHQRLQEQPVRVPLRPPAAARRRCRHGDTINQPEQGDQTRARRYHPGASWMDRVWQPPSYEADAAPRLVRARYQPDQHRHPSAVGRRLPTLFREAVLYDHASTISMSAGLFGVPWALWGGACLIVAAIYTVVWPRPEQTAATPAVWTYVTLRWRHAGVWLILALSCLLRTIDWPLPALAQPCSAWWPCSCTALSSSPSRPTESGAAERSSHTPRTLLACAGVAAWAGYTMVLATGQLLMALAALAIVPEIVPEMVTLSTSSPTPGWPGGSASCLAG